MTKQTKQLSPPSISRRETLRLLGAAGALALMGPGAEANLSGQALAAPLFKDAPAALPPLVRQALFPASAPAPVTRAASTLSCVVKPSQTEGPYFVDELLNRADIRTDPTNGNVSQGAQFKLRFNVFRTSDGVTCTPLIGAHVDIWHCDAFGIYSDATDPGFNTVGQKFLRGYQITDSNGSVEFTTIYPGWYSGRTVHIHFKIRLFAGTTQTYTFTSQLYFDDTYTDQVFATQAPYNTRGARTTRNSNDGIYSSQLLVGVTQDAQGYNATFEIGLQNVPASVAGVSTVSAASLAASTGLASEALGTIYGTDLATSTAAATTTPLPTTLGGAGVRVRDASGTLRTASLLYASPTQVNFLMPASTSVGTATVLAARNGTAAGQGTVVCANVAPALFAANGTGQGVAAAVALRVRNGAQTLEPAVQFNAAQNTYVAVALDLGPTTDVLFLLFYGTGLRNRSAVSAVSCTIGGVAAAVTYIGAQGQLAGLDQVNVVVPRALAGRGEVDVVLTVDGKAANTVKVNIL